MTGGRGRSPLGVGSRGESTLNAVGTAPEKKYDACTRASDGVPAPARGPSSACARCRMGSVADTVVLDVPDASVSSKVSESPANRARGSCAMRRGTMRVWPGAMVICGCTSATSSPCAAIEGAMSAHARPHETNRKPVGLRYLRAYAVRDGGGTDNELCLELAWREREPSDRAVVSEMRESVAFWSAHVAARPARAA